MKTLNHIVAWGGGAGLLALLLVCLSDACVAGDAITGLGSAFRPQAAPAPAPVINSTSNSQSDTTAAADGSGLRVVRTSPSHAVASINGRIVHVGDIVDGLRVTQIDGQGVELAGEDGTRQQLMINPSAIKIQRKALPKRAPKEDRE